MNDSIHNNQIQFLQPSSKQNKSNTMQTFFCFLVFFSTNKNQTTSCFNAEGQKSPFFPTIANHTSIKWHPLGDSATFKAISSVIPVTFFGWLQVPFPGDWRWTLLGSVRPLDAHLFFFRFCAPTFESDDTQTRSNPRTFTKKNWIGWWSWLSPFTCLNLLTHIKHRPLQAAASSSMLGIFISFPRHKFSWNSRRIVRQMKKRNATHVTDEHSSTHFWLHWQQTFTLGRTLSKTCHPLSLFLPTGSNSWLPSSVTSTPSGDGAANCFLGTQAGSDMQTAVIMSCALLIFNQLTVTVPATLALMPKFPQSVIYILNE